MANKSQQFLNELAQFYRNKGQHTITADTLVVRLNGKPVNLYELYTSVIELGGSYKVNLYNKWDEIYLKLFAPQPLGSNVSVALRQVYQKYLLAYEKVNYSNFISDNLDNDDDEGTNKDSNSNFNLLLNHQSVNAQRQLVNQSNLNPLNKLFCSLMSDLPNEMDFGLRVATILTNSDKIDHLADFKFVDVIIECCILYICSCDHSEYSKCTDYCFEDDELLNFKNKDDLEKLAKFLLSNNQDDNSSLSSEHKENICDKSLESINRQNKSISTKFNVNNVRRFVPFKDCRCFIKFWCKMVQNEEIMKFIFDLTDDELNQLYEDTYVEQEEQQKNYYKIKRIANLLKNLSYSIEKLRQEQNSDYDEHRTIHGFNDNASINLLRFFILLLNSNDQSLVNIALEIISNISPLVNNDNMVNLVDQNTYVRLLIYVYDWCVDRCLNSLDVNCLNRCLEILTKLVNGNHVAINRLIISEVLDQTAYFKRLTELLTCQHDVGVVILALECTLSLSENYPKMLLNENKHLIKVLINLINCEEGLFFTSSSIKKIRIIDERRIEYNPYQMIHQPQQQILQPQQQTIFIQNQPITTHKIIQINDNQALLADNELHLKNWLYSNFESRPINATQPTAIKLKLNDIYTEYVKHSCLSGRRNVVTSTTFSSLLKKHFPSIAFVNQTEIDGLVRTTATTTSINKVNIVNSNNINLIQQPQLQQQPQIQIINSTGPLQPNNLTSPILKAHLSTPPKSNSSNQISNPSIINSNNLQPLPNGPTAASPLIKNLLATKLRNNQTATTVNSNLDDSKSIITTTNLLNQQNKNFTLVTNQHQGTNNLLIATNSTNLPQQLNTTCITTSCTPTNLITVPIQQHILPNQTSNSMIINTNQLNTVPVSTSTGQQILLVRTILPQQSQQNQPQNLIGTTANQQPMRLILSPSVLTSNQSQMPQTINVINGTNSNSLAQQSIHNTKIIETNSVDSNKQKITKPTDNQLIKTVLRSPPLPANTVNSTESKPISNNVKSSPLLNVLLDKGKLPEYSTIASTVSNNNAQDKTINKQQIIVNNSQPSQSTNHIISGPSSTLVNSTSSSSNPTISSISNQIVATSTVNSSSAKMYILTTTTKSPITIKNASSTIQTSNSTAPIQSFVIQQPKTSINQTTTTVASATNGIGQQPPTQFIFQQNPTTLVNSQNTMMISQPLIIQQPSTVYTTIQNPKLDQNINTFANSNKDTVGSNNQQTSPKLTNSLSVKPVENSISMNDLPMGNNIGKDKSNEVPNCLIKEIKKEIVMNGEIKGLDELPANKKEENHKQVPLTNGCLEKDKTDHMETDEPKETQKDSLLKRQLESNDIFAKRPKADTQITIMPVSSAAVIKTEVPMLVNSNVKQSVSTVVVSSNGILPNQPTISNTIIQSALNSIPKTNSSTCTIEKITIAKPNVLLNSNLNENQFKITPVIQQQIPMQQQQQQIPKELEYICEWSNCKKSFPQANMVFLHVHQDHINTSDFKATKCLWGGPDGTGPGCKSLRPKYSLLTHLQDFHCGVQQLKQVAQRNQQLLTKGITDIPPIVQPPEHPGYANNAASLAIKRRWTNLIENKPIPNISPLSKSVRLTAAMILRNLAQHSNKIKRILKNYESFLSELCMFDNREDSRTLAQCLAIITEEK